MKPFIGRKDELQALKEEAMNGISSLIVIRGRRRIGKSRLIIEFGRSMRCLIFSGIPPTKGTSRSDQIEIFVGQMQRLLKIPHFKANDWGDVFFELAKHCAKGKILLALDEISWIGSKDRHFLGQLKNAWDLYFSRNPNLILVICGSVSSWIEQNILSSTGFLGRISLNLHLKELLLVDSVKFWQGCLDRTSASDILKILSVTGGVPRYLEAILPQKSADQNIQRLCFDSRGFLYDEFDCIFSDLFSSKATTYEKIIQRIATGDAEISQIHSVLPQVTSSTVLRLVHELIQAGFVSDYATWSFRQKTKSRLKKYRLTDNYMRFYLNYVLPHKENIAKSNFKIRPMYQLPNWDAIMGLQFENLVVQNCGQLLAAIGESSQDVQSFGPYFQRKTTKHPGCQIDLLIQMRYRTLFICEVKFLSDKVGMDAVHQLKAKQQKLPVPRGWSTRLVLVHANGVSPDVYQSGALDHIVGFSDLIEVDR